MHGHKLITRGNNQPCKGWVRGWLTRNLGWGGPVPSGETLGNRWFRWGTGKEARFGGPAGGPVKQAFLTGRYLTENWEGGYCKKGGTLWLFTGL